MLIPHLGLIRTSFCCGLINVVVALVFVSTFQLRIPLLRLEIALVGLLLGAPIESEKITRWAEEGLYPDPIVLSRTSPYQRLVVTRKHQELRLYINGNLQFSSRDEYRYHEALVHPPLSSLKAPQRVLILGGGDGLAAREILRYPSVEQYVLVNLDPRWFPPFSQPQHSQQTQPALLK